MTKGQNSLPKIVSTNLKIMETTPEKTVIRTVGIPFGGPDFLNGKDLHDQRFTRSTDFGKDDSGNMVVNTVYAFYDHALNENFGKEHIGYAKFYQETDEGQIWDIEVRRSFRYHDMILALAEKGFLGASSQPVQTSVEIDWESGDIKRWHPAEISLTTQMANPLAVAEVMKSFGITDPIIKNEVAENTPLDNVETNVDEVPEVDEEIASMFQTDETDDQETEPTGLATTVDNISEAVKNISAQLTELQAQLDAIKTDQAAKFKDVVTEVTKTRTSIKTFASGVAEHLKIEVKKLADENSKMSEAEREAEDNHRQEQQPQPIPSYVPKFPGRS